MLENNNDIPCTPSKSSPSKIRKIYILRLVGRIVVLLVCAALLFLAPEQFEVLDGWGFFRSPSALHVLWVIWLIDMILQLIPAKANISLGSKKNFMAYFLPIKEKINKRALKEYILSTTRAAYKVFIIWVALTLALGTLYLFGIIPRNVLFMFTVIFYVCDLICVLIWCPFRLIMKNKCCTTCRIFNWDHIMMFSPLIFVGGFFAWSLVVMAALAWLVWEACIIIYP